MPPRPLQKVSISFLAVGLCLAALCAGQTQSKATTSAKSGSSGKVATTKTGTTKAVATKSTVAKSASTKTAAVKSAPAKSATAKSSITSSRTTTTSSRPTTTRTSTAQRRTTSRARSWRTAQLTPTPDRYKEIQQSLADKGYFQGPVDGVWGPDSTDALKRFQRDQNLDSDGKIGSLSLVALGLGPNRGASAAVLNSSANATTVPAQETATPAANPNSAPDSPRH